jgi:hypothetical protein
MYHSDYISERLRGRLQCHVGGIVVVSACMPEFTQGKLFVRGHAEYQDRRFQSVPAVTVKRFIATLKEAGLKPAVIASRLTMGHSKLFVIRKENL